METKPLRGLGPAPGEPWLQNYCFSSACSRACMLGKWLPGVSPRPAGAGGRRGAPSAGRQSQVRTVHWAAGEGRFPHLTCRSPPGPDPVSKAATALCSPVCVGTVWVILGCDSFKGLGNQNDEAVALSFSSSVIQWFSDKHSLTLLSVSSLKRNLQTQEFCFLNHLL